MVVLVEEVSRSLVKSFGYRFDSKCTFTSGHLFRPHFDA
jgi:hypothetical protein